MRKWNVVLMLVLCLMLTACGVNTSEAQSGAMSEEKTESTEQEDASKTAATGSEVSYFKSDETVNKFFSDYNAFAETTIPADAIEKGNIKTKALVYMEDFDMEVINAGDFLSVSLSSSVENEGDILYPIFRDTILAVCADTEETDIQSAWNALHETGAYVESFDFSGISITYVPSKEMSWGTSDLRIDLNIPIN